MRMSSVGRTPVFFLLLALLAPGPRARAQDSPSPAGHWVAATQEALEGFDAWVAEVMEEWKVPGMGIAIVRDGQVVHLGGYGYRDVAGQVPVTPQTLFAIGSASNAFTTYAMGILVDEGKLDFDEPTRSYLPGLELWDEYAAAHLTPRDMVTHRSGLPRHDAAWYNRFDLDPEALFDVLGEFEPNEELRARWQYNNMMFVTAGYLVSELAGEPWEDAVRRMVLDPLGMRRTDFSVHDSQRDPDHALPYGERDDTLVLLPFRDITNVGPAGSINSCVEEMAHWVQIHLAGGKFDGEQLIQASTLKEMHTPQMVIASLPNDPELAPQSYGMGWFVDGYRGHLRVHHGGNIDGFSALVSFFPQDNLGFVVLTNKNGNPLPEFTVRQLADRIFDLDPRDWSAEALARQEAQVQSAEEGDAREEAARKEGTQPDHPLEEYAGEYEHPGYGILSITLAPGESLVLEYNGISAPLEHWHFDVFRAGLNPDDPAFEDTKIQFHNDMDGEVEVVSVPLEPAVAPIRFTRRPDAELSDPVYLQRFVGGYELAGAVARVALTGNTLSVTVPGQPTHELEPGRDNHFTLKGLVGYRVQFIFDDEVEVMEALFKQPNGFFPAKRVED